MTAISESIALTAFVVLSATFRRLPIGIQVSCATASQIALQHAELTISYPDTALPGPVPVLYTTYGVPLVYAQTPNASGFGDAKPFHDLLSTHLADAGQGFK
jgi:hypothetical protein